ncbi:archaeosortase A [Natronorarus salvus]|uniref:archaeosortase A n=1 Tax=Natronorarus salvus TaxID=3117733 RepID=UPI002F26793F
MTELSAVTDPLLWAVVAAFLVASAAEWRDPSLGRRAMAGAWVLFAGFWLLMIPFFAFEHRSVIQTVLVAIGVPACLAVAYHLSSGRVSLLVLSRAVTVALVIYIPFETVTPLHDGLIEVVAAQTEWGLAALGTEYEFVDDDRGLRSLFVFPGTETASGGAYSTRIVFACTGIGSMAIFGGLTAAVRAPLRRRLAALGLAIGAIWVMNVVRNVFIAHSSGEQLFAHEALVGPVMTVFGLSDPVRVSFFVADRILSQGLAVVALLALFWVVLKLLPELAVIVEDLLYLLTGTEYDLLDSPAPITRPSDD